MFGFTRGDSDETVLREKANRKDAPGRWSFLTPIDLSSLKTAGQMSAMIKVRAGLTREQADADVRAWLGERRF